MKRILAIAALAAAVSAFACMPQQQRMPLDELDLTDAQKQELRSIRKEARTERLKLTDALEELRDKTQSRMMALLTDEQKAELTSLRKEMRGHRHERCEGKRPHKERPEPLAAR